jgi:hypothetical protein
VLNALAADGASAISVIAVTAISIAIFPFLTSIIVNSPPAMGLYKPLCSWEENASSA